jgi:hypothetical protein
LARRIGLALPSSGSSRRHRAFAFTRTEMRIVPRWTALQVVLLALIAWSTAAAPKVSRRTTGVA